MNNNSHIVRQGNVVLLYIERSNCAHCYSSALFLQWTFPAIKLENAHMPYIRYVGMRTYLHLSSQRRDVSGQYAPHR